MFVLSWGFNIPHDGNPSEDKSGLTDHEGASPPSEDIPSCTEWLPFLT